MRPSFMLKLRENFEHLAFERMVRACHADLGWEVSEVGSVSRVSSTKSRTSGCSITFRWIDAPSLGG